MDFTTLTLTTDDRIATITLNRPERLNAINRELPIELEKAVQVANDNAAVHVIVLHGAGRAFCAGYDLDWGTRVEHESDARQSWDPVRDFVGMSDNVRRFMSLWHSRKPVIAQVHGWCVGGGTDLALCSDLIVAATDAQIGYPPARVWGSPTSALWAYRLGMEQAKRLLLTGDPVDGAKAEQIGLIYKAVPPAQLAAEVSALAQRMALLPINQLIMMKLLVNQAYENMGLRSSQIIGTIFDGIARHTPEGVAWRELAMKEGFKAAVAERDDPFGDYASRKR
ncbi:MAG: crotonase/enoyl-CoA hydratase family protein [Deltaproteobacteria bacterium]|nr:crotonase/enoyl-CoA hydratase family protein [Deltaproteobacteria bacterium]MBI3386671.1 crotonase/enoyl-CoA hydratase family protein [Deltaproteobacteria bacterium]